MHPAPFDYLAARSVEQACQALSEDPGGTRVLAGGQSLLPRLVRRLERPDRLVDITRIAELQALSATPDALHIGAAVTQRTGELFPRLGEFGVLAQALPRVGKTTTRNRGTICGSIAHANPAAELGVCLLALGGEVTAVSTEGSRSIGAQEFFVAPFRTALRTDELAHTVTFLRPAAGTVGYFDEVTLRGAGDTPLVSAAVTSTVIDGRAGDVRIVVGGAGQVPVLVSSAITGVLDGALDDGAVDHVSSAAAAELEFHGDAHGSADHRSRLAVHIVARLLRRLRENLP
ncbi:CO/xanthine dehydrogenase FAD-binding subunit [Mycobacterium frederiksbergense]|uniref:CO/xanthine dehydrogenase FAD-binding subunit n=1 Tax=Mycolicibacterium frederiksbergense TaxID=117567 RepID=A0ABT6KVX6_9MYCO|nr:FAD binding domain-containing protein [Mycolicibacterium frederiksbergense]MDH6194824.1 CO/xanthine dehydrogenase FAD-binding subunit [Mycolicibacterium frederiksbergense]